MTEGETGLIKDSINDGIHGVEDYISEEYREIKDDFVSGLSPMDSKEWKDETWTEVKHNGHFRFVLHFIFIALPYLLFDSFF